MYRRNFREADKKDKQIDSKDRGDLQDRKIMVSDIKSTHPAGDTNKQVKSKLFNTILDTNNNEEVKKGTNAGRNIKETGDNGKEVKDKLTTKLKSLSVAIPRSVDKEIAKVQETRNSDVVNRSEQTLKKTYSLKEKTDSDHNSRGTVNKDKEAKPARKPFIKTITCKDANKILKAVTFIDEKKHTNGKSLEVKIPNEKGGDDNNHKTPENYETNITSKSLTIAQKNGKITSDEYPKLLDSNGKTYKDKFAKFPESDNKKNASDRHLEFIENDEKAKDKHLKISENRCEVPICRNTKPGINYLIKTVNYRSADPKFPDDNAKVPYNKIAKLPKSDRENRYIIKNHRIPEPVDKSTTSSKTPTAEKKKKGQRRKKRTKRLIPSPDASTRVRSPPTEVAKWAPSSINHLTRPYYEAWVNTTLAAISRTDKKDKLFLEKQNLLQNFEKILNARAESPDLTYENFADERYIGRIKVRQRL